MKDFMFKAPTKLVFGVNAALNMKGILESLSVHKIFVVTDKVIEKTPSFIALIKNLRNGDFDVQIFSDTEADPPIEVVDAAANVLKKNKADIVIAVGGGSSIDTAKAMCMLETNEGSIKEYLFGGTKTVINKALPLICVPTTAGSGSEVTAACVITDNENNIKLSVTHEYLMPLYAVIDPIMQMGMPEIITASTGMDALTHAIEAYISLNSEPISDAYAEKAIRLIGANIRTATHNPSNIEARSNMAIASVLAATSFVNAGLGAVHGIAQSMGGVAHTPHGIANSLILPYVMEHNMVGNVEKFANIAKLLGESTKGLSVRQQAMVAITAVRNMAKDIRIPTSLREVNITREMFPEIVKGTMGYRLLAINPIKIREEDVYLILENAF
jgi:alcohol dehydrogenase class IV